MEKKRKIAIIGKKVSFADAEEENVDLLFWAEKTIRLRMEEAFEWKKKVWQHINGGYPLAIEKTGGKRAKKSTDEDDF